MTLQNIWLACRTNSNVSDLQQSKMCYFITQVIKIIKCEHAALKLCKLLNQQIKTINYSCSGAVLGQVQYTSDASFCIVALHSTSPQPRLTTKLKSWHQCQVSTNANFSPYLLATSAWYVIYVIQWSTLRLYMVAEIQPVIFNLHINIVTSLFVKNSSFAVQCTEKSSLIVTIYVRFINILIEQCPKAEWLFLNNITCISTPCIRKKHPLILLAISWWIFVWF